MMIVKISFHSHANKTNFQMDKEVSFYRNFAAASVESTNECLVYQRSS